MFWFYESISLQLLIGLQESLGVEIPEPDYSKLTTLNGMVSYLSQRLASK